MTAAGVVVIGVGNEYRRDDGIGPAVLADLETLGLPGVRLVHSDGEPTQLFDAWTGAGLAVVVDAVRCEPVRPGQVHRTTMAAPTPAGAGTTHGIGIPEAVLLGTALELMPRRLVVYAVEAADLGFGVGLSDAVEHARSEVVRAVVDEIESARDSSAQDSSAQD